MKRIVTLRHSFKNPGDGDVPLSVEGQRLALEIGHRLSKFFTFSMLVGSDQIRTTQTGILILAGMGEAVEVIVQNPGLCGPTLNEWKRVISDKDAVLPRGVTLLGSIQRKDHGFYAKESKRLSNVYLEIFAGMEDSKKALVIGHSPLIEMAVVTLTGGDPNEHPALEECSGYVLILEGGKIHAEPLFIPGP